MDNIKYVKYSTFENYIIIFDKFDRTYGIHSKDEENDTGIISGFATASEAITFAEERVNKKGV